MTLSLLLVEDEPNYRRVFKMMVMDLDLEVREASNGKEALAALVEAQPDLIVTDLNMPEMDGLSLLRELRTRPSAPPVVVITAHGSVESAVQAMQEGAIDYLQKPFDEERLGMTLRRALRMTALLAENRRLREEVEDRYDFSQIVGESPPLVEALRTAGRVAATDSHVLIRGESGTGKELVARAIHYNSPRSKGPFVAVNCAALPDTLLEGELFGAEAGAYTGATKKRKGRVAAAEGGTLFLDEIGDMPLSLQSKLLRLIQERTYTPLGADKELQADTRFVFATHQNLEAMVAEQTFREDSFYRVAVLPIVLPPLRQRGNDVLLLARAFVEKNRLAMGRPPLALSDQAIASLRRHRFAGNVRELANLMERAVILSEGELLDVDLPTEPSGGPMPAAGTSLPALPPEGIRLEDVERSLVEQALRRTDGNKSQAAKLLGLSRATLRYRIEKLGLG